MWPLSKFEANDKEATIIHARFKYTIYTTSAVLNLLHTYTMTVIEVLVMKQLKSKLFLSFITSEVHRTIFLLYLHTETYKTWEKGYNWQVYFRRINVSIYCQYWFHEVSVSLTCKLLNHDSPNLYKSRYKL